MNDAKAVDAITDIVNGYLRGEQSKFLTISRICAALGRNADHRDEAKKVAA